MSPSERHYKTQLAVIGSGLAGVAASLFAMKRGIDITQIGDTGAIAHTTGYFDLFGKSSEGFSSDPFQALAELRSLEPHHILSRIADEDIEAAFHEFTQVVSNLGVKYSPPGRQNHFALLPGGSLKPTYSVPLTMLPGIKAREAGAKALVIDILGLQGFSAIEFVANMKAQWPQLSHESLSFPDMESGAQIYPEVMARALEVPRVRERFARRLKELKGEADIIGMPAILGIHKPDQVHAHLEELAEVELFEIPTIPPGVPGIRLREMFEQKLPTKGVILVSHQKVKTLDLSDDQAVLHLKDSFGAVTVEAQGVLLATGRFLSGGLSVGRDKISEALLDLRVTQPKHRDSWYREHYFDPRGHAINRSGIEIDADFRPLDEKGNVVAPHLFAAGALLAHQDWIRQRCGAGVAIASAYKAVQSIEKWLPSTPGTNAPV